MAYDDHGAYQASSRAYHGQQRQQGPTLAHRPRDQHHSQQRVPPQTYDQGYDYGHDQGYNYGHDQGYGAYGSGQQQEIQRYNHDQGQSYRQDYGSPQSRGYDQGYGSGYQQQERGHNQQQRGYGNSYDPGHAPPGQNGQLPPPSRGGQRPQERYTGPRYDEYQQPPRDHSANPRFVGSAPQHSERPPVSPMYSEQHSGLPRSTSDQGRQKPRPPPLDRSGSYEPAFTAPRRPLIEPISPAGVPQDNAFPVFPNLKTKASKQMAKDTAVARSSQDRPSTSSTPVPPHVQAVASPRARPTPDFRQDPSDSYGARSTTATARQQSPPSRNTDKALPPVSVRRRPHSGQQHDSGKSMAEAIIAEHMSEAFASTAQKSSHVKQDSQSEIYADYYSRNLGELAETPVDRNAQIEADMPDFGTANGSHQAAHKRGKTVDEHLATAPSLSQSSPPLPQMPSQADPRATPGFRRPSPGLGPHPANMPPRRDNFYPVQDPRAGPAGSGYSSVPPPHRPDNYYGRPSLEMNTNHSAMQRPPTAPPAFQAANGYGIVPTPEQNPDALPQHPAPFRPGLMDRSGTPNSMSSRTPSQQIAANYNPHTRNFTPTQPSQTGTPLSGNSRRSSANGPVTQAEINHLQAQVNARPQDSATALSLAKKLVEAANVLASQDGRLDARQTAKNRERYILDAHRRVKKLVGQGYPEAMFYLADCYGQGLLGLEEDPKEAFGLYQAAAKAGHGQAAYRTALCCEIGPEDGGGTRRDIQKAVQWYRRAAQLQDITAMYKLGIICLRGLLNQQKNVPEAERWLKRAAEKADKENPHALHELGLLYEPDNPDRDVKAKVIPDENYSRELFFKAANMGFKSSQFRLGQAHEYGALGLPVDARNSIAWYSKAAAQGEHGAELALSGWYLTGAEGILENSDQEAYLWARKAASADPPLAKAMFAMGYYTETGIGCPANMDEAKRWYGRAASYKFPKAIDRLEEMKRGGNKGERDLKGNRLHRKDIKERVR